MNTILIKRVKDPFGWLGNMSPHAIEYNGVRWPTAEALFQALRFPIDHPAINEILNAKGPMAAKLTAQKHASFMSIAPRQVQDVENMRMVLKFKIDQHPELKEQLIATTEQIIEDCSNRKTESGLFWGAAFEDRECLGEASIWVGNNILGKLWMELREECQRKTNVNVVVENQKCIKLVGKLSAVVIHYFV